MKLWFGVTFFALVAVAVLAVVSETAQAVVELLVTLAGGVSIGWLLREVLGEDPSLIVKSFKK